MTKNEFKQGDKVTLTDDTTAVGVIRHVGKETCVVDFGMGDSTVSYRDILPLDRKTAFLTELQALLRKYDAKIYHEGGDALYIDLLYPLMEGKNFGDVEHITYSDTDSEINADNIMDFDKEGV